MVNYNNQVSSNRFPKPMKRFNISFHTGKIQHTETSINVLMPRVLIPSSRYIQNLYLYYILSIRQIG